MTSFRTELTLAPSQFPIDISSAVVTIGSCFSDRMGERMTESKFNVLVNPMGILYSPLAIHRAIENAVDEVVDNRTVCRDGIWNHYDYHSKWGNEDQASLVTSLKHQNAILKKALVNSRFLMITYGTAWGFRWKSDSQWVANCHKTPATEFDKQLISSEEFAASFSAMLYRLHALNPDLHIILTVSPVRHVNDTLPLNAVSKSVLRLACYELEKKFSGSVEYFPAFELLMDDLRDYRFYEKDMIHPNDIAIDYLWNKFSDRYFSTLTREIMAQWNSVKQKLQHKSFHQNSPAHQSFLKHLLNDLHALSKYVDVSSEIKNVKSQLHAH